MLAGYYDDSYDNEMFVVAGLVNTVSAWKSFSDAWQRKLDEPPAIGYYKASEARVFHKGDSHNQFRGFSEEMVLKKEIGLGKVIGRHGGCGVISLLHRKDFQTVVAPRVGRTKHGLGKYTGHEYHFPFMGCITSSVGYLQRYKINDRINFFFDEQGKVGKWARDIYEFLKEGESFQDIRSYMGTCTHHDDKAVIALQAADLVASLGRKWANKTIVKERTDPVLDTIYDLPVEMTYWFEWTLKDIMDTVYPIAKA